MPREALACQRWGMQRALTLRTNSVDRGAEVFNVRKSNGLIWAQRLNLGAARGSEGKCCRFSGASEFGRRVARGWRYIYIRI